MPNKRPSGTRTYDLPRIGKEKVNSQKVDLAIFAVRELGPNYPYFSQGIKHSKTGKDRKLKLFSSEKDTIKHKKIPVLRAGKINLDRTGLEPVSFYKYPHVRADCSAKNGLCGLEENRRYGCPQ